MQTSASSILTIDLAAIAGNYAKIKSLVLHPCVVAGVVKANAYGLGVEEVAKTLEAAGALIFFVATLEEGIELRRFTSKKIAVLNGLFSAFEKDYAAYDLRPVLCSLEEIDRWNTDKPCYWQVDTGMNRLGLRLEEFEKAFSIAHIQPSLVMSHLACADDAGHPKNTEQLAAFKNIATQQPLLKYSLANSSGVFLGADYHFNIVRPGMALYGLNPTPEIDNPMAPVVTFQTRILQIHEAQKGETVGYGAAHSITSPRKLATVSLGYADGFHRAGSNKTKLYWQGHALPVLGRVSMDLIVVDITDLPVSVIPPYAGDFLEVIGPHQSVDALAADLGTIGYEVLTSLAGRSQRIYKSVLER